MSEKILLSWQAPEYKNYSKNLGWYITYLAISILIVGFFAIVQNDYFASITIGIIAILILFFANQSPEIVENRLTDKALEHGYLHIPYKQIKHFWVVNKGQHKTLNLETGAFLNSLMIIELGEQNADEVRNLLLNFIPEHEQTEPHLTQRFSHWIKF